jgi:hypothetical protein
MPTPVTCRASRRLRIPATPEVFDHDRGVGAYQVGGQLVQAIGSNSFRRL